MPRLDAQLAFFLEIDKLKLVLRQTYLTDKSRRENSAEHSWHIATMAPFLAEYAAPPVDIARVIRMLLVHDIVEIDAGDTLVYDTKGYLDKPQREQRAADRIFGILPADQASEIRQLWDEFEARQTPEARFAAALDRLQPILHNYHTQGAAWRAHGIHLDQVIARNRHIGDAAPRLWEYVQTLLKDAVEKGYLAP
jgi:putative hydrolase of HD superfamily